MALIFMHRTLIRETFADRRQIAVERKILWQKQKKKR
nr:MAG TPA: hypothetical protein [Caudoviricetes sp.]